MRKALLGVVGVALMGVLVAAAGASPISFDDLARHVQFKMAKISPDGTHVAVTSVLADGQTVLSLLNLETHGVVNVTPRAGEDVLDFWWVSPTYVVYNEAEHDGGWDRPLATGELYSVAADGSSPAMLFGYRMDATQIGSLLKHASAENGTAEFLAPIDGDPLHFLAVISYWGEGDYKGQIASVYRMDVRNGTKERVTGAPMRSASFLADHHGHVRFAFGDTPDGKRQIYLRPAVGGDWQLLAKASAERDWPLAFSADDQTVWFECAAAGGFGLCKFDPAVRAMTAVWSNPRVEPDGLARGFARDSVIGVRFTDGRPSMAVFDGKAPAVQVLAGLMHQFPGEDARFVSGTADGSKAIAVVEADADPGTFYLYDRARNTFAPLLQRAAWIDPSQFGRAVPFTFTTRDGLSEQGYVTYPPGQEGAKNLPLVVFVHGGPYGVRDWWEYDPYVQALVTRGYAVLQVNFRGSGGYGFDFVKAGWLQWGGKMQDDVTDATRWAIRQGIADKNRICIYGGSYGGYAALEGAVKQPDLYKCAIGYVGVYDLPMMFKRGDIHESLFGEAYLKRVLGTDMAALAARSPINQLDSLKARVMLVVGGRDTRVPPAQGERLHGALKQRGVAHEWLYKSDESHGFYDQKNIAELFQKVDAFLDANIGPGAGTAAAGAK